MKAFGVFGNGKVLEEFQTEEGAHDDCANRNMSSDVVTHTVREIETDRIFTQPKNITMCRLEVVLMPNGELLCMGNTVGYFKNLKKYLHYEK